MLLVIRNRAVVPGIMQILGNSEVHPVFIDTSSDIGLEMYLLYSTNNRFKFIIDKALFTRTVVSYVIQPSLHREMNYMPLQRAVISHGTCSPLL